MFRISKMTDYGTVVLSQLGDDGSLPTSASDVASRTGLGTATVSKLLKSLGRANLVTAQRGSNGGYYLSRPAESISAAEIIDAIEGPLAITECSSDHQQCDIRAVCSVGSAWQSINRAIRSTLVSISLADLKNNRAIPDVIPLTPMMSQANNTRLDVRANLAKGQ
ncbi:MAG: SUF system Fe-S cluster assembly regulator [Pseudomonadota bacterium]